MMTTMAATLKTLDELTSSDRDLVGSKAYNCGRLRQAAFPVPDGIVIPADVPDRCVREFADHEWFARQPADALFAVRSSGIGEDGEGYSFAGIHETHLNVPPAEVVEAVLVCRRSAASPQALAYRASRGLASDEPVIGAVHPGQRRGRRSRRHAVSRLDHRARIWAAGACERQAGDRAPPDR